MSIYLTIVLGLLIILITNKIIISTVFKVTAFLQTMFEFAWFIEMLIIIINIVCSFVLSYTIIEILNKYFKIIGY